MFKAPRGTADILSGEQPYWRYVVAKAEELCCLYGYERIDTPTFEDTGVFERTNPGTDIVEKEMYTFEDRGGNLMTLRPEGTAPVCRAYIEHGMHSLPQPVKLYYFASIFRYERPQAGRYREHHQFGLEALGDGDPAVDAEVIDLAWQLCARLGLRNLSLIINSIGDPTCRPAYIEVLRAYYADKVDRLCPDCRQRLVRNPLRLLDCKEPTCRPVAEAAPRSIDHLCAECREHFERLETYLNALGLPYIISHRLVRGLDYYTRTVFEIQPQEEGAQNTIAAGGRYDGLIEQLGGRPTPGIGFATGIERLVLNLKRQSVPVPEERRPEVYVAYLGDEAKEVAVKVTATLRQGGLQAVMFFGGRSLKAQMRHANSLNAGKVIVIGEEELRTGLAQVRDMATGEQRAILMPELVHELRRS